MAELVTSALASATIDVSLWIPCGLTICPILLCLVLLAVMPQYRQRLPNLQSASPHPEGQIEDEIPEETNRLSTAAGQKGSSFKRTLSDSYVLLAIPIFPVGSLRYTVLNILMQYTSVSFGL